MPGPLGGAPRQRRKPRACVRVKPTAGADRCQQVYNRVWLAQHRTVTTRTNKAKDPKDKKMLDIYIRCDVLLQDQLPTKAVISSLSNVWHIACVEKKYIHIFSKLSLLALKRVLHQSFASFSRIHYQRLGVHHSKCSQCALNANPFISTYTYIFLTHTYVHIYMQGRLRR